MATNRRWREKAMRQPIGGDRRSTTGWLALPVLGVGFVLMLGCSQAALAQEPGQKAFNSATEATDAFAAAVGNHDEAAMLAILGPSGRDLISSGDPVADRNKQNTFAAQYHVSHQYAAAGDGRTFLYIGTENWPTPIPLQKNGSQWYFDTKYGKQEILYRRIGSDELNVIRVCAAIADAQRDYYAVLHDGASEHQYAQRFRSTAGTQDGLFWEVQAGVQPESPLGPLVAEAASRRLSTTHHRPTPSLPRLHLSNSDQSRSRRAGWRQKLYRRRQDDRRIRAGCLSCQLSQLWSNDLHRQPGRSDLSKGSGSQYRPDSQSRWWHTIRMRRGNQSTKQLLPRLNRKGTDRSHQEFLPVREKNKTSSLEAGLSAQAAAGARLSSKLPGSRLSIARSTILIPTRRSSASRSRAPWS